MDKTSIELARHSLAIANEVHSPAYEDVRESLLGRLSLNGLHIEDLRQQEEVNKANLNLVSTFVASLPNARRYFHQTKNVYQHDFAVDEPFVARHALANTLWVDQGVMYPKSDSPRPFYIVGARPITTDYHRKPGREATDLLLISAQPNYQPTHPSYVTQLATAQVYTREYLEKRKVMESASRNEYDNAKLEQMHDPISGKLLVDSSQSVLVTRETRSGHELPRRMLKHKLTYPLHAGFQEKRTITDEDLALYDVPGNLDHLAVVFQKTTTLDALYDAYAKGIADIENMHEPVTDRLTSLYGHAVKGLMDQFRKILPRRVSE